MKRKSSAPEQRPGTADTPAADAVHAAADRVAPLVQGAADLIIPLAQSAGQKVGPLAQSAAERVGPLAQSAAEKVGPLAQTAAEKVGPLAHTAADRMTPLAQQAYIRVTPYAQQALGRVSPYAQHAAVLVVPLAQQAADRVGPLAQIARQRGAHAAQEAVDALGPKLDEVLQRVSPAVDAARTRVNDELLPKLNEALTAAAATPVVVEATKRGKATVAAARGELSLPEPQKSRSWLKRVAVLAALSGVAVVVVRQLLGNKDADWQSAKPTTPYVPSTPPRPQPEATRAGDVADLPTDAVEPAPQSPVVDDELLAESSVDVPADALESPADGTPTRDEVGPAEFEEAGAGSDAEAGSTAPDTSGTGDWTPPDTAPLTTPILTDEFGMPREPEPDEDAVVVETDGEGDQAAGDSGADDSSADDGTGDDDSGARRRL